MDDSAGVGLGGFPSLVKPVNRWLANQFNPKEESNVGAPLVFFDIAGSDGVALREFYSELFGWDAAEDGQFEVAASAPLKAAIREDPPEKRLYIGVSDVAAVLERIAAAGGSVDAPRFEVPGVVVLGLFTDPAGNPMGLVEMDGDEPRIP